MRFRVPLPKDLRRGQFVVATTYILTVLVLTGCGPLTGLGAAAPDREEEAPLDGLGNWAAEDFSVTPIPSDLHPYRRDQPIAKLDSGVHDATGVRMFEFGEAIYDHPVGQARYGLDNVAAWEVSGDKFYLDRAIVQATRIVETRHEIGDAWLFPYHFDYRVHGAPDAQLNSPWYSAMAQGLALSLFVRLSAVTSDPQWVSAAEHAYQSLNKPGHAFGDAPALTQVSDGHLWFEEYPAARAEASDHTLNGHIFAIIGLADYFKATNREEAADLIRAGATTVLDYWEEFRVEGGVAYYCLQHLHQDAQYQSTHTWQLASLAVLTGDERFAEMSELLISDVPG